MTVQLNHLIVWSTDQARSAHFLADLLGLPPPLRFGRFHMVALGNGVSLDFATAGDPVQPSHYAFLIDEAAFDAVVARLHAGRLPYWADPLHRRPGAINHDDGGRGVYFSDPDGHNLKVMTRPYGG